MADPPSIEQLLSGALSGMDNDDVQLFYQYFEELKRHVRRSLSAKPRQFPGESHIAQSALFSLFCDLAVQQVPLNDVDEEGYPMVWPMLLKYIERHCEKWKKYYRAKKRAGVEVAMDSGFELQDRRSSEDDEAQVSEILDALYQKLTPRQRQVADLSAQGKTLAEIAAGLNCSESLVSMEKKAIRKVLETT